MTQKRLSYNSFLSVKNPRHPDIKPQESPRVSSFIFYRTHLANAPSGIWHGNGLLQSCFFTVCLPLCCPAFSCAVQPCCLYLFAEGFNSCIHVVYQTVLQRTQIFAYYIIDCCLFCRICAVILRKTAIRIYTRHTFFFTKLSIVVKHLLQQLSAFAVGQLVLRIS